MGYFRYFYVLPAGLAFGAFAGFGLVLMARRGRRSLDRAAVAVWVLNLAALVVSSIWYFHSIREAGNYRG